MHLVQSYQIKILNHEVSDVVHDEHRRRAMEFEELKREMQEIKTLLKDSKP